jgi:sugar phosphate permease
MGSAGSGIGQYILGLTIQQYGWTYGYLLPISCAVAATVLPLGFIFLQELQEIRNIKLKED